MSALEFGTSFHLPAGDATSAPFGKRFPALCIMESNILRKCFISGIPGLMPILIAFAGLRLFGLGARPVRRLPDAGEDLAGLGGMAAALGVGLSDEDKKLQGPVVGPDMVVDGLAQCILQVMANAKATITIQAPSIKPATDPIFISRSSWRRVRPWPSLSMRS